jgi:hypothetical protein
MIHVIKLAVGIRDIAHLQAVQSDRSESRGERDFRRAFTRNRPARPDVTEGSLYWVIQGVIRCRQRIFGLDLDHDADGRRYCLFRLDPTIVPVMPTPRGPFQGWRYLELEAAPADLTLGFDGEPPPDEMMKELRSLGLI